MTIEELLNKGICILKDNKIEDASLVAKIILANIIKKDKTYLITHNNLELKQEIEKIYIENIERIAEHEPMQYIIGNQEFMKLDFCVDENVLIPRADTEILVEEVLKLKKESNKVLDLCTGSGAIGISIAVYNKYADVYLSDISEKALNVANENAKKHNVKDRIKIIQSNMFENIKEKEFDIIVSNPPYIETDTINNLDKNVLKEPRIALDGGKDGLDFYKIIIKQAKDYLKKGGYLAMEIGYNQKESVINLLNQEEVYKNIYCKKDIGGNDRIIIARLM